MAEFESVDITSPAFQTRLANLLVATRTRHGQGVGTIAKDSSGRFSKHDLKAYEAGERPLDESTVDELAILYGCDLGVILPLRLPVAVSANRVSAGGVHQEFDAAKPEAVLAAYLALVRTLRRQGRSPVVDLRRDDVAVLAGFLQVPRETVIHNLASLMHATQTKRTAMVGVLATGAVVIGLVGTVAAVSANDASPPPDPTATTTAVSETTAAPTTSPETTVVETTALATTTVAETTVPPETTLAPTTVPAAQPPAPPTTAKPVKPPVTTTTVTMIDTNLTEPSVDPGSPPLP
jgi:hypothetical protein